MHKFYFPHAGAEAVLFNTEKLLRAHGHEVEAFAMEDERNLPARFEDDFAPHRSYTSGAPIARIRDAAASVYSFSARNALSRVIDRFKPQVAHLHIFSHQLTFSVVDALKLKSIPIVMTLHDYKISCPAYTHFRHGQECHACSERGVAMCLRNRCIKQSFGGSAMAALEAKLAQIRGSWKHIDLFIAPSDYAASCAYEAGIPARQVRTIQNFLPLSEVVPRAGATKGKRFLLACRLEQVKGVEVALDSFLDDRLSDCTLVIAGAGGGLIDLVRKVAELHPSRFEFHERISRSEVIQLAANSLAVLVPSVWPENNPISLLEARAAGTAVIASKVGGLGEMVTDGVDGLLIDPGDKESLIQAIRKLADNVSMARDLAAMGDERLNTVNSESDHYSALMEVYESAIESSSGKSL